MQRSEGKNQSRRVYRFVMGVAAEKFINMGEHPIDMNLKFNLISEYFLSHNLDTKFCCC